MERVILEGLQKSMMAPDLVEEFVRAFAEEVNRQRRDDGAARAAQEQELAGVKRKLAGLIDAVAEGLRGPDLQSRLDELSARKEALLRTLKEPAAPPVRPHPRRFGQCSRLASGPFRYRRLTRSK